MPAGGIFAAVLTAAVLFAVTNADDILVLTVVMAIVLDLTVYGPV